MVIMNGPLRAPQMSREEKKSFEKKAPGYLRDIRKERKRVTKKNRKRCRRMQKEEAVMIDVSVSKGWQFYD